MATADVAVLYDSIIRNPGFIVIKPTDSSKRLYKMMKVITTNSTKTNDMQALNRAISVLRDQKTAISITLLNKKRFVGGRDYFQTPRRLFAPTNRPKCNKKKNDCAVMVHNTWIVGKSAKVYRFRENLMWVYDSDNQYYTSNSRLYMTYTNRPQKKRTSAENGKILALKTAMTIGHVLNRTVILPRFHVGPKAVLCPLNCILHIHSFEKQFAGHYRENSFLFHPKVPLSVKFGLSKTLEVDDSSNTSLTRGYVTVTSDAIVRRFSNIKHKVLIFGSFFGVRVELENNTNDIAFKKKLGKAFFRSNYVQLKRW